MFVRVCGVFGLSLALLVGVAVTDGTSQEPSGAATPKPKPKRKSPIGSKAVYSAITIVRGAASTPAWLPSQTFQVKSGAGATAAPTKTAPVAKAFVPESNMANVDEDFWLHLGVTAGTLNSTVIQAVFTNTAFDGSTYSIVTGGELDSTYLKDESGYFSGLATANLKSDEWVTLKINVKAAYVDPNDGDHNQLTVIAGKTSAGIVTHTGATLIFVK